VKKFMIIGAAAAVLALPLTASAAPYAQPGYDKASANTICADHGTFGYLGEQGERHDLGQGDTTEAGSVKLGANGPATGWNNSTLCGNR
jgi:hypothetical protein